MPVVVPASSTAALTRQSYHFRLRRRGPQLREGGKAPLLSQELRDARWLGTGGFPRGLAQAGPSSLGWRETAGEPERVRVKAGPTPGC